MSRVDNLLSVKQAQMLSALAAELEQYPKKRGAKKRYIPPELKVKISKAVNTLPKHVPATLPAKILGLAPSRIRLWAKGQGTGPIGGDQHHEVEKPKKKVYAKTSSSSEGFNLADYAQIQKQLWDAVSAEPGQRTVFLASALSLLSDAVAREVQLP